MTDDTAHTDDLDLEATDSEAVAGGAAHARNEMEKLEREGFIGESCTTEGTLMVNPKTHERRMVKG